MPQACLLIRNNIETRTDGFREGLEHCGFTLVNHLLVKGFGEGDVVVAWNRHQAYDQHCRQCERRGGQVIVVENGYIGLSPKGEKLFAMALGHHVGAGSWKVGKEDRFSSMGVKIRPWRKRGDHILVLPQRGIGETNIRMPARWTETTVQYVRARTRRPVKVRAHPGKFSVPMEPDLENCHAAVVWASGAGIKALAYGVPVFYDFKSWIGAPAAVKVQGADLEQPFLGDRLPMFHRLSYAQWSIEEVRDGTAFQWLLSLPTN